MRSQLNGFVSLNNSCVILKNMPSQKAKSLNKLSRYWINGGIPDLTYSPGSALGWGPRGRNPP
jgi:hypothetical protein